jgi:hypothetical protein
MLFVEQPTAKGHNEESLCQEKTVKINKTQTSLLINHSSVKPHHFINHFINILFCIVR